MCSVQEDGDQILQARKHEIKASGLLGTLMSTPFLHSLGKILTSQDLRMSESRPLATTVGGAMNNSLTSLECIDGRYDFYLEE